MKKKFFVLFVVVVLGFMMSGMSVSAAEEYSDDTVISQNTILGDNIVVSGKLTVKDGATLTVPEGIVLTVKEGASVEARGNIDIKGKIIVEKGGRFFRKEYLYISGDSRAGGGCRIWIYPTDCMPYRFSGNQQWGISLPHGDRRTCSEIFGKAVE